MKKVFFDKIETQFIKDIFAQNNYVITDQIQNADLLWTKNQDLKFFINKLQKGQQSNQLPYILEFDRKDRLFQYLNDYYKNEHQFYPLTFVFRKDIQLFLDYQEKYQYKDFFIAKQSISACGRSISIIKKLEDDTYNIINDSVCVCQKYIDKVFTHDNKKFDFRMYALIYKNQIFLHELYLIRLCTEDYQQINSINSNNKHIHLTNTTINKSKISNIDFFENFKQFTNKDVFNQAVEIVRNVFKVVYEDAVYQKIQKLNLQQNTEEGQYFALLGIDVIMNDQKQLNLLEINQSPSMVCECDPDLQVKTSVLNDLIAIINDTQRISAHKNNQFVLISQK